MRTAKLLLVATTVCSIMLGVASCRGGSSESVESNKPADELSQLMEGNRLFAGKDAGRADLVAGQSPGAVILACSDSRVSPELLFKQGLGDLFVVRVAGNVSNVENIASIEYAIENLNSSLVMVMGHESCGAVQAAVKGIPDDQADMKNLAALVQNIRANITSGGGSMEQMPDDPTYRTQAIANVRGVIKDLTNQSSIISRAVKDGTVTLVPAIYGLKTGKIEVLPDK